MAIRYGGKHSPSAQSGAPPGAPTIPSRDERRAKWLFLAAIPLAVRAFWQEPIGLVQNLGAFATLVLAAWLTREGVRAASAYAARRSSRRPAIPRKLMATALTGMGLFLGVIANGGNPWSGGLLGLAGSALHLFAFGPDPLTDKAMDEIDIFQQDRVARVLVEGEAYLKAMKDAALRAGDRDITARVDRFLISARTMFRTVEEDPRDLTAARRYLGVYLMGARDATIKFADIWTRSKDQKARADFQALLTDLETNFDARTRSLLSDDKTDLEIEIDVLRDRLKREGLKTQL
ncbi:MAG: 5-bromo-4-chloroindolyl phosphate hydrolysis family protein [Rhodobacteraceae bacterium]|nr:5-bromo-4-chloroindolyl phosphate hydrolysis family protein [Paracoccaceae bacterium]MCP5342064.1 5-bromo-4-chloroindolyl phosphate hydrolysis family protein [Paracoccaceae bacterium]